MGPAPPSDRQQRRKVSGNPVCPSLRHLRPGKDELLALRDGQLVIEHYYPGHCCTGTGERDEETAHSPCAAGTYMELRGSAQRGADALAAVRTFTGEFCETECEGLDLEGDFVYAVNVLGSGGMTAGDATFTDDRAAGISCSAQLRRRELGLKKHTRRHSERQRSRGCAPESAGPSPTIGAQIQRGVPSAATWPI